MPYSPASIANINVWYRADSLALTNGTAVSSWSDSSPSNFTATQATGTKQPTFNTNQVNGLPALTWPVAANIGGMISGADMGFIAGPGGTVFVVVSPSQVTALATILGPSISGGLSMDVTATGFVRINKANTGAIATASSGALTANAWVILSADYANTSGGAAHIYKNGTSVINTTSTNVTVAATLHIGYQTSATPWQGQFAEMVTYERVLSALERAQVHSYLQDKYGIVVSDYTEYPSGLRAPQFQAVQRAAVR